MLRYFARNLWIGRASLGLRQSCFYFSTQPTDDALEFVEAKVFQTLKAGAKCKTEKLSRSATFEELGFDSLDIVELVCAMEQSMGIELSQQEAEKVLTVNDAIQAFYPHKKAALTQE